MKTIIISAIIALCVNTAVAASGDTYVAKWKFNARAAFTMSFDDSMNTHAHTAMPAIIERGLVGTWFINPGLNRHKKNRTIWEVDGPNSGQEYANHTWEHNDVNSYEKADFQMGESARYIWNLRGARASKLLAFIQGGGTTWNISREEIEALKQKYHCIRRSSELSARTDKGVNSDMLVDKVKEAISESRWVPIHFHGIGGEWLSIDTPSFMQLLAYLANQKAKNNIWSAGWIAAYQYIKERDRAVIDVLERSEARIRIRLTTGLDTRLYAEPLTLITSVPSKWTTVTVTQDDLSQIHNAAKSRLQFEALPDRGIIVLQAN